MTKQDVDIILALVKEYVKNLLSGWGLSDTDKSLIAFEQKYMPYTEYSGKQSVDHVLFRKFLRHFDPKKIEENVAGNVIEIYKGRIEELEAENEALRKKLEEIEQLTYAAL